MAGAVYGLEHALALETELIGNAYADESAPEYHRRCATRWAGEKTGSSYLRWGCERHALKALTAEGSRPSGSVATKLTNLKGLDDVRAYGVRLRALMF